MTKLRQRMEEDMRIRNLAQTTKKRYLSRVTVFANYFNRSPALLGPEEARTFLLYLSQERKLTASSINVTVCALRFFYKVTLGCKWDIEKIHLSLFISGIFYMISDLYKHLLSIFYNCIPGYF